MNPLRVHFHFFCLFLTALRVVVFLVVWKTRGSPDVRDAHRSLQLLLEEAWSVAAPRGRRVPMGPQSLIAQLL